MTPKFSSQNLTQNTWNCNMASSCITSNDTCRWVKSHTRGNSEKVFAQALSHYLWQTPLECKVQAWIQFYQSNPIWKWDVRVSSIEDTVLQGRGSNSGHHLPRGGDGSVVRVKYRERTPHPYVMTYDRFQTKMSTLLSFSGTKQKNLTFKN